MLQPTLETEQSLIGRGFRHVVGMDEVGRGCWAGMVTVGAVRFKDFAKIPDGIRDSKLVTPKRRSELFNEILKSADVGIGSANEAEIDKVGIVKALGLAAERALENLSGEIHAVILDGNANYLPNRIRVHVETKIKADERCLSAAAASIMAKVTRDRLMELYDAVYPGYGFASHKGYASPLHQQMLKQRGISEVHRRSYAPMKFMTR